MLNPIRLFDTEFNSLQLHVRHVAKGDSATRRLAVEVRQSFTAVFALFDAERPPDAVSFSLKSLFDKVVVDRCNAARRSTVLVDVTHFRSTSNATDSTQLDGAEFTSPPSFVRDLRLGATTAGATRLFAGFELHGESFQPARDPFFNLKATLRLEKRADPEAEARVRLFSAKRSVPLGTHRFLTGFGQNRNGVKTYLRNRLRSESLTVSYVETLPWFARIAFNSLRVEIQRTSENDSAPFEPYAVDTLHVRSKVGLRAILK